jgi:hypothetical protein
VQAALFAEMPVAWLDCVFSLGYLECRFDVVAGAADDGLACVRGGSGWAADVVCVVCG